MRIYGKHSKGFEPMTAIVIGLIVTLFSLGLALPSFYTTTTIMKVVTYEYNYDNSQAALLSLLSSSEAYQRISYFVSGLPDSDSGSGGVFDKEEAEAFLKDRLDKLVESRCYRLSYDDDSIVIVESSNAPTGQTCSPSFKATAFVALPYGSGPGGGVGKVELKIG